MKRDYAEAIDRLVRDYLQDTKVVEVRTQPGRDHDGDKAVYVYVVYDKQAPSVEQYMGLIRVVHDLLHGDDDDAPISYVRLIPKTHDKWLKTAAA